MGQYTREELRTAFERHTAAIDEMSRTGEWSGFVDLFTEDVHFVEYNAGVFDGRDELEAFIMGIMKSQPHMRYPAEWVAYDEDNGAVVIGFKNIYDHPTEPGIEFAFPNVSRFVYAGNDKFSLEEDIYNPAHAHDMRNAWVAAGGVMPVDRVVTPGKPVLSARRPERVAPATSGSSPA